jgi:hypothetical protein
MYARDDPAGRVPDQHGGSVPRPAMMFLVNGLRRRWPRRIAARLTLVSRCG